MSNALDCVLADIALPVPLTKVFSYLIPVSLATRMVPGSRVICPFGTRRLVGVVLAIRMGEPPPNVKSVENVLDDEPTVHADLLSFLREVANYYLAPIGEVIRLALPPVERDVVKAISEPTLFPETRGVASPRRIQWVIAKDGANAKEDAKALSPQAAAILAYVRSAGPTPIARLEEKWKNARTAVKKLDSHSLISIEERAVPSDPFFAESVQRDVPPELTQAQIDATQEIARALVDGRAATFLLHGVTGSGKTEVYLRAIEAASSSNVKKGTLVLVPEIALTPQLVSRFRARFGDDVAVIHSGLTPRERLLMWRRLHSGEVNVAIGARSALFAPVRSLGLVIVDEEHDPSFKQEEGVRYHARDMAILRAHRGAAVCVLGSATPSLESEHLVRTGKAKKLSLPDRARSQNMPHVEIIDLRRIGAGPSGDKRLSLPLHRALESVLAAGEQAILFLNRRGFAPSVRCESCGLLSSCPHCSISLTLHKKGGTPLRCHYCDYQTWMPSSCPKCKAKSFALEGLGTEKLEETLARSFPSARIARLDRDVASGRSIEKILNRVRGREVDLLVGTQMVTKGHDLPHVTLVGVINADAALSIPDFRAAERAFHLLVQVAGRAGRGDAKGRVLIQTHDPDHPAIVYSLNHDVDGFMEKELVDRRELSYPPFSRLALVRVDATDEDVARKACAELAECARSSASSNSGIEIVGPAPAPLSRLRNRYRFQLMVRGSDRGRLRRVLVSIDQARERLPRTVRSSVDVDPMQFL